jgi:hypothetical protein
MSGIVENRTIDALNFPSKTELDNNVTGGRYASAMITTAAPSGSGQYFLILYFDVYRIDVPGIHPNRDVVSVSERFSPVQTYENPYVDDAFLNGALAIGTPKSWTSEHVAVTAAISQAYSKGFVTSRMNEERQLAVPRARELCNLSTDPTS